MAGAVQSAASADQALIMRPVEGVGMSSDPEAPSPQQRQQQQEPIGWCTYSLHVVQVGSHLFFIATALWAAVAPGELRDGEDIGRFVFTLLLAPMVIYETAKHWSRGTFFPMTASDSFHVLRFGCKVDKNPPRIRCGTLLAMLWMGAFFSTLAFMNFAIAAARFCPGSTDECGARFAEMSAFGQWKLRVQYYLLLVSALLQVKTVVLTSIFSYALLFAVAALAVVTFGYAWVVLIIFCVKGFNRESKVLCVPCAIPYDFVALFYRNL